jgi:hypothetical protein
MNHGRRTQESTHDLGWMCAWGGVPLMLYRSCGSAVAALRWGLDEYHHTIAKRLKRTQTQVYSHPSPLMLHETRVP